MKNLKFRSYEFLFLVGLCFFTIAIRSFNEQRWLVTGISTLLGLMYVGFAWYKYKKQCAKELEQIDLRDMNEIIYILLAKGERLKAIKKLSIEKGISFRSADMYVKQLEKINEEML